MIKISLTYLESQSALQARRRQIRVAAETILPIANRASERNLAVLI